VSSNPKLKLSSRQGSGSLPADDQLLPKKMSSPSTLPDPALPAPPLSDDDVGFTADQLIARQRDLEEAAREAVPFSFLKGGCTYEKGYIRQPVFACKTCGGGGVCAGCSVGCHADHDLVELFAKRSFRCDCGSLSLCRGDEAKESELKPCSLRSKDLTFAPQNDDNKYGKNFKGQFCRCERGKTYNAETEEEASL
jgi:E3 ubiquitin-protein ligase UBR7